MREKTKSILVAVVICKMTTYCIENKVTFFSPLFAIRIDEYIQHNQNRIILSNLFKC